MTQLQLDSVFVENPARNCDTIIYGTPSKLQLTWVTGIDELINTNGFQLVQNYPNPFAGTTKCTLRLQDKKNMKLVLADVYGQQLAVLQKTLDRGKHTFTVETGTGGIYFLTVSHGNVSKTLKLTSRNTLAQNSFNIRYSGNENIAGGFKFAARNRGFTFLPGDLLNMIPYATAHESSNYSAAPVEDYTTNFRLKPNLVDFMVDTCSGHVPLLLHFMGYSNMPNISNWHWDFGDGETSDVKKPDHIYQT